MDQNILDTLYSKAEDFGAIARKVNESSKIRKNHAEKALKLIDQCIEIGETLHNEIDTVSKANVELRNQDNIVQNTCKILNTNIECQKKIINELMKTNSIDPEIAELLLSKIDNLSESLEEALLNISKIIDADNAIILLDKQILMWKEFQLDSINKLKKIAQISLDDAEKAINGSSSNLDRGLEMIQKYKNVEKLIKANNQDELNELVKDAKMGWNIAENVNKSSKSQYEFAEVVNKFTRQLHSDSSSIKEMMAAKHHMFEDNLQTITVLTVILSLKFKKYMGIKETAEKIEYNSDIHDLLNDLIVNINIACGDIEEVMSLNYDMTDSSHLNNELEDKTVKLTKTEIECYDEIKKNVEAMTEATMYPVEGSGKNIKNGQILEESLKEIIKGINQ